MADRYCRNCANELRPGDRFCPGCGRPVRDTAVVTTPEVEVPVPLLPRQGEVAAPSPASRPGNVVDAFKRADTSLKEVILAITALVALVAVARQTVTGYFSCSS